MQAPQSTFDIIQVRVWAQEMEFLRRNMEKKYKDTKGKGNIHISNGQWQDVKMPTAKGLSGAYSPPKSPWWAMLPLLQLRWCTSWDIENTVRVGINCLATCGFQAKASLLETFSPIKKWRIWPLHIEAPPCICSCVLSLCMFLNPTNRSI